MGMVRAEDLRVLECMVSLWVLAGFSALLVSDIFLPKCKRISGLACRLKATSCLNLQLPEASWHRSNPAGSQA